MSVAFKQTLYIAAPANDLWDALTRKEIVDRYYLAPLGTAEVAAGGEIFYGTQDNKMIAGKVLELEKPHVFSHSFRFAHAPDEPVTVVKYEIEPIGDMCALHLTHEGFPEETQTFQDIAGGWPVILSALKTLVETGNTLPWPQQD